ncbi:DNA (cytosine-5-)-methyltransferase [Limimaricola variabilis]
MTQGFTFIDLFAGIGGLRQAMEDIGGRCVFTSEWDKFARQTYEANYRDNRPIAGDISKICASEVPEHDVLCAGFPCQPFSLAGVSKKNSLGRAHGFLDETQGTLFFDVVRILKHRRPSAFMLENVKNLTSHDRGKTFRVIIGALEELGYTVHSDIVDARHFLPQHRQRIVIVGFIKDTGFSFDKLNLPPKGSVKLSTVLHSEDGSEAPEKHYTEGPNAEVSKRYILSDHLWGYLQAYKEKHAKAGNGFGCSVFGPDDIARTLSARYHKDGSEILISRGAGRNPRRLTPRECARLMGYSDDFTIPVSDTQAYRQFGNSVAVPVFREVARAMASHVAKAIDARNEEAGAA